MKEFISHIDFLIQKHDCIIIPGFGGFVLSHEEASFSPDGSILPPKVSVGFNPDLRYKDGLLVESYMKVYDITYDVASKRIDEAVKRLDTVLSLKHPVQMGQLGKLELNKHNKIIFAPNSNLSIFYPETFGLSRINLKLLSDIDKVQHEVKRKSMYKHVLSGIATAAAAVLVFFIASTPISENNNTQKSGLFTDWISTSPVSDLTENKVDETITEEQAINEIDNHSTPLQHSAEMEIIQNSSINSEKNTGLQTDLSYFVIISGAQNDSQARQLVNKFKTEGFDNVGIVRSDIRTRIYVESFSTKAEAERYLSSFKKDNPRFHDAWVHHQN